MKIVFVAPFGLGQKTTVWARILPLAKVVAKVVANSPRHNTHQVHLLIPPWDTPEDAGKSWVEDGVTIEQVQLTGGLPFITFRLLRAVHNIQPDIVHIIKPRAYAGIIQWLLWMERAMVQTVVQVVSRIGAKSDAETKGGAKTKSDAEKGARHPLILLDIDDWEQAWNEISGHGPLLSRFLTWQEEWGIRHADGISAASRWLQDRAQQYTPDTPILYLPNGVAEQVLLSNEQVLKEAVDTVDEADTISKQRSHKILYFTRYVEVSPTWLAHFWQSLCTRVESALTDGPDSPAIDGIELVVAGGALQVGRDRDFRQSFEAIVMAANVQWLGLVDGDVINQLYQTSSCAIFPAAEVPLQQAKCSVRMMTTLLHGLPVVASAVGQQSEYGAKGAAYLVPTHAGPEAFADAVYNVLANPAERIAISTRAQAHLLQAFHWETLGESLRHFYEESLAPSQ